MNLSLVAVVTDVIRNGKPVIGYGFNSNGRYGQGKLMRDRFIPRVLEADPASLIDASGKNLDPHKIWDAMFTNEKPRSEEHTSELQSLMRISYAVFCLKQKTKTIKQT